MVLILCEDRLGVRNYTHIIEPLTEIPEDALPGLEEDMRRLLASEPLQYVLGHTEFYGRDFLVNPSVLIPRPETEQLVKEAVSFALNLGHPARVLDLCTGSGCIAWSVLQEVPGIEVVGVDISVPALETARAQFPDCAQSPSFIQADVLADSLPLEGKFDLVVSNPPYIKESQKSRMRANVLDYEPGIALFVPDEDPLVFYRAVARHSKTLLSKGGTGIVEINEDLGPQTAAVFLEQGWKNVFEIRDFYGETRFIRFSE